MITKHNTAHSEHKSAALPLSQCCFPTADALWTRVLRISVLLISSRALTKHDSLLCACRKNILLGLLTFNFRMLCVNIHVCAALYPCRTCALVALRTAEWGKNASDCGRSPQRSWISSSLPNRLFPVSTCLWTERNSPFIAWRSRWSDHRGRVPVGQHSQRQETCFDWNSIACDGRIISESTLIWFQTNRASCQCRHPSVFSIDLLT